MSQLLAKVKQVLGRGDDENAIGCRAIVDEESGALCDGDSWGRGCVDGHEVKYCESHAPGDAASAAMGGVSVSRIEPVQFYIPESDEVIEVR